MAFLPKRQETQNQTGAPALSGDLAQSFSSNAASAPTRGGGGNSTNTSSPGAVPSAPWGNISEYLRANQGQSGQLAGKIAGGLTDLYGKTTGDINQTGQNFQGLVDQNKVSYDSGLVENAANDPTRFVQNQGDVDKFKRIYNANYGGPASFSQSDDYAKLQGDVQKAQERAGLANQGYAGIQQLVGGFQKNPTQGIRSLDTLLLQQDPNNAQTIRNAATPFQGLKDFLLGKSTTLDKSATDAAQETAAAKQQAQERFLGEQGAVKQFEDRLTRKLQEEKDKAIGYSNLNNQIISNFQNKTFDQITPEQYAAMGLNPNDFNRTRSLLAQMKAPTYYVDSSLYGGSPGNASPYYNPNFYLENYLTPGAGNTQTPTREMTSTQKDFSDDAALNQLIGGVDFLSDDQTGLAGSYNPYSGGSKYDQSKAYNDLANQFIRNDTGYASRLSGSFWNSDPQRQALSNNLRNNTLTEADRPILQQFANYVLANTEWSRMSPKYRDPAQQSLNRLKTMQYFV